MWRSHFQVLLNSSTDTSKKSEVQDLVRDVSSETIDKVTAENIQNAVKDLKRRKRCGPDKVTSDHLI